MAARKQLWHPDEVLRFYVYVITEFESGEALYVGKGSGRRVFVQAAKIGGNGSIAARFKREQDAYAHEVKLIAELAPRLNKCRGGNGSTATKRRNVSPAWVREMDRIGLRAYVARLLLRFDHNLSPSKIDEIRRIAHG